jgi:hypothetical protein
MDALICSAIAERRLMMFGYANLVRVVEPHLYGVNSAGHLTLSVWLRPGYSRSDPRGGWRNYLVADIYEAQVLGEAFPGPRPGFNPADPRMERVICALPAPAPNDAPAGTDGEATVG